MLAPIAQITCIGVKTRPRTSATPPGANVQAVAIRTISTNISQSPRFSRNAPSAAGDLRASISPALVPARNTNTGAQKCVTQRVKNSAAPTSGFVIGSCSTPSMK
jgi:hypothetical protein